MANYATALEVVQLKEETTYGTLLGADTRSPNLRMSIAGNGDANEEYTGSGHLYASDMTNSVEGSGGSYEIPVTFNETRLIANSVFKKVTGTGMSTKTRLWEPAAAAADPFASYSIEKGQDGAIEKFGGVVFNSFNLSIQKKGRPMITGDVMGQESLPATALTAVTTTLASRPVPSTAFNLYQAATFAGLSSPTQITTGWKVDFAYGPKYGPAFFIGSAEPSHDAIGTIVPNNSVKLTLPKNVTGADYGEHLTLDKKRKGTPVFLRLKATGNNLEVGIDETFQLDLSTKIRNVPTPTDIDVYTGLEWDLGLAEEAVASKVLALTTISSV